MTPEQMASIHKACFTTPRPWTTEEFKKLLSSPLVTQIAESNGFALGRIVDTEAELLTIAVRPSAQNKGLGRVILTSFVDSLRKAHVEDIFLEVAETNSTAILLYESAGFARIGYRKSYYQAQSGLKTAAIVMKLKLS